MSHPDTLSRVNLGNALFFRGVLFAFWVISSLHGLAADFDSNFKRVNDSVYFGSEPQGDGSFRFLAERGIKIIVSVDGAKPDVEGAREAGLRYVHIPIGYDGIPTPAALSLVKVMQEAADSPVFIHCHHGKHRGPAAAAIACRASNSEYTAEDGTRLLKLAGTSPDYRGLWDDVAAFIPPDGSIPLPELEETAKTDSLMESMAALGRAYDDLKHLDANRWAAGPSHPDLVPETVALLAWESLRESARFSGEQFPERYHEIMEDSESHSLKLVEAIRNDDAAAASRHFQALRVSCKACHRDFRD